MGFWDFEDVVENIIDEVFLDKQRDDGAYDYESLPKVPTIFTKQYASTPSLTLPRTSSNWLLCRIDS
jgi:hypothetical protein